jgi:hypothetical protein
LRLRFEFLGQAGVGWADAGVEDVARFVAWPDWRLAAAVGWQT